MEKFLITRTDRLGDVVLTIAMLPILEKHFPDPRLSMRVGSYAGGLSMDSSCVDDVLIYDGSKPLDLNGRTRLNFLYRSLTTSYEHIRGLCGSLSIAEGGSQVIIHPGSGCSSRKRLLADEKGKRLGSHFRLASS